MRRYAASLMVTVLLFAMLPAPTLAGVPTDVDGHWAQAQVLAGVAAGYISGYPDGTFRPDAPITRAEFFKLLSAALRITPSTPVPRTGFDEENAANGPLHWSFAQGYAQAAVASGLLVPSDYGSQFGPDVQIKRREILLAAVRALGQEPIVYQQSPNLTTPDAGDYPTWLQSYAALGVSDKVITGYADGSLGLDRTATRAEALVIVQRILGRVMLSLAPANGPAGPHAARSSSEGEPLWTWTAASGTPTLFSGNVPYTFPFDIADLTLLPAPGNAAWLRYTAGTAGVVALLSGGKLTEIAHYPGALPDLLAVGDDGRLWYSDGNSQLLIAEKTGQATPVAGVNERLRFGDIDWTGNFWGLGAATIYQITPNGVVTTYDAGIKSGTQVIGFAIADDDTAWILTGGAPDSGNHFEAIALQTGAKPRHEVLFGPYYGGVGATAGAMVVGRNGPLVWLTGQTDGASTREGLYRLDLTTGVLLRQVMPRSLPADLTALPAPGGGVLLQEPSGKLWRILP